MKVDLAYGTTGLTVELPENTTVLRSRHAAGLPDEAEAIRESLRHPIGCGPLRDQVRPGCRVVIVHTDITRATPNDRILPMLLAELENAGADPSGIVLLNALGTHRPQTEAELIGMLGERLVRRYRCIQHNAFDDNSLASLGMTSRGHPARVNRTFLDADIRVLTGFIEPHFFAGFSGGPKGVLPSIAGAESVFSNHGFEMLADPRATWGVTDGNPVWEEMKEIALRANPTFLLNVTMNAQRRITGVFAGDMLKAHAAGCDLVRDLAGVEVPEPFDVVVTSASGYPLDQNLYQGVKGLSAAARIVRPGGAIVLAAACADGLPSHGRYATLLARAGSPRAALDLVGTPGFCEQDQWQVQVQAMVQQKAEVHVYSDGLSDEQIRRALLKPCRDLGRTVRDLAARLGPRVAALPEGPLTMAYIKGQG